MRCRALMDIPVAEGQVFNIGSQEEITINELAARIREKTNSRSEIAIFPLPKRIMRISKTWTAASPTCQKSPR